MKRRLRSLLLLPTLGLLVCCSKDNSSQPTTIVAKWNLNSWSITGYDSLNKVLHSGNLSADPDSYAQYNTDGTYQLASYNRVYVTGTYVYSNNILAIEFYDNSVLKKAEMSVLELSSKRLRVEFDEVSSSGHTTYTYSYTR